MTEDIRNLIFQAIDQTISIEDFDRLQDAIENDVEVRAEYLSAVNLSESLAEISSESRISNSPKAEIASAPKIAAASAVGSQNFRYSIVALCAVMLTACSLIFTLPRMSGEHQSAVIVKTVVETEEVYSLAKIVQRIACVMQNEKWNSNNTEGYEAGQSVLIAEGLAVIEFKRGAKVTLEGPANLEIVSDNSGFLHSGKLTAVVPDSAIGFEILTPTSRVIDHGTEFAVSVDENGNSETHVFDGEVELVAPERENRRLTESMAARVTSGSDATESLPANPRQFIRIPNQSALQMANVATTTDLPNQESLVTWFEASQGVQLDSKSRVISWENLAASKQQSVSENQTSTAWQVNADRRPVWEPGGFGKSSGRAGRPYIEFRGKNSREYLVTAPIKTGKDVTVLIVASLALRTGYAPILSFEGKVKLRMTRDNWGAPTALTTSWNEERNPPFLREDLEAREVAANQPVLCAIRYSHDANKFQLFVNGELEDEGEPLGPLSEFASQVIGSENDGNKHFFNGSIAEIVVYDHMLDREAFDQAATVLMEKYEIK